MEPTPPITLETYQLEPADILREKTIEYLKSRYKDIPEAQLVSVVGSLLYDVLSENKISGLLHRFAPEDQEKALLGVGAPSLEEAIQKILDSIQEDTIAFHINRLGKKRDFDL